MKQKLRLDFPLLTLILAVAVSGCATTSHHSVADAELQQDLLSRIQTRFGDGGLPPTLVGCKLIDQGANGSFVESWKVKFPGTPETEDFVITVKPGSNGQIGSVISWSQPIKPAKSSWFKL